MKSAITLDSCPLWCPLVTVQASRALERVADQALTSFDCHPLLARLLLNCKIKSIGGLLRAKLVLRVLDCCLLSDPPLKVLDNRGFGQCPTSSQSRVEAHRSDIASSGPSITSGPTVVETWKPANQNSGQPLSLGLSHVDAHSLGTASPCQSVTHVCTSS